MILLYIMNITSKKVIQFYKNHPSYNINEINEYLVDFLTNVFSQSPNQALNENAITTLLQSINNKCNIIGDTMNNVQSSQTKLELELNELQKNVLNTISLKLYDSRDQFVKDFEKCINSSQNTEFHKHQQLATENLDKLLDKLRIYFNDQFTTSFDSQFRQFSKDIHQEFLNATQSGESLTKFESTLNSKYETLYNFILQNNHEFRTQLTKLDYGDDISHIKTYFERQKNSSNKGNDGEIKLENILNELFPTANVVNTSGKAKSGDFIVERDNLPYIMFENKDYAGNVPVTEVDKFIRDIECTNTHGIFLSQCSGISKKENFQIDVHDNKIIIFVHNVQYSIDKIRIAVIMLDHLIVKLEQLDIKGDTLSEEMMSNINKEFTIFVQRKTSALDLLKRFNKDMLKNLTEIELPEINKLLSCKFSTNDTSSSKCNLCGKIFKTPKGLAAHSRFCNPSDQN